MQISLSMDAKERELVSFGNLSGTYTTTGRLTGYRLDISHSGLHEHRLLRAPDMQILRSKAQAQLNAWSEKWTRVSEKSARDQERKVGKETAETLTTEAQAAIESARLILQATLDVDDVVDWSSLEDHSRFEFRPTKEFPGVEFGPSGQPLRAKLTTVPPKPDEKAAEIQPRLGLLDKVFAKRRQAREQEARNKYDAALASWQRQCEKIASQNEAAELQLREAQKVWQAEKAKFEAEQEEANKRVRQLHARYMQKDHDAVVANAELVLNASKYPDWVKRDYITNYDGASRLLVIDAQLPEVSGVPTLTKVTYIASRGDLKESHLSASEAAKLYDSVVYQITLRTLHEIFESDAADALDTVVFNGWVTTIDEATGKDRTSCIVSVRAAKQEFLEIDLGRVDPKACFKKLKGIAASKLASITPIAPMINVNTDDARFVASYEVASRLSEGSNLAAMDWEDFEHLVRELFEREFASGGAEVKVTRASADGGVDAVVFDPDPIRGGKIVIQAKRYTNTVGVSAVRDLFGTMSHEGAMKGILVTTSDFGPDAYRFAQDKPITLLNGGILLHLLAKHGHKAHIDIAQARMLRTEGA